MNYKAQYCQTLGIYEVWKSSIFKFQQQTQNKLSNTQSYTLKASPQTPLSAFQICSVLHIVCADQATPLLKNNNLFNKASES